MSFIYNVTIEATERENLFHITWYNPRNNTSHYFLQETQITPEETQGLWPWPRCQWDIGQKLFRFLDDEAHHFQQALEYASQQGTVYLKSPPAHWR
jgi:hypothetical protein